MNPKPVLWLDHMHIEVQVKIPAHRWVYTPERYNQRVQENLASLIEHINVHPETQRATIVYEMWECEACGKLHNTSRVWQQNMKSAHYCCKEEDDT